MAVNTFSKDRVLRLSFVASCEKRLVYNWETLTSRGACIYIHVYVNL